MELREIYLLLLRKKFYLILIPVVAASIMLIERLVANDEYVSEAQLSTGLTVTQGAFGEMVRLSPYAIAVEFTNVIETIKSKRVVSRLNYQMLLHDLTSSDPFREPDYEDEEDIPSPEMIPGIIDTLELAIEEFSLISKSTNAGYSIDVMMEAYGYTEEEILEYSSVERKGESEFINILFVCEDPFLASHLVNTWVTNIIEYNNYTNATRQSGSLTFLRQNKDQKEQRLNESVEKLSAFRSSNEIMVNTQDESANERVNALRKDLNDEQSNARRIQLTLDNLREKIADLNTNASSNNRNEISALNRKISRLSDRLFNEPDNAQVRNELNQARSELQQAMYKYNSSANTKLDELFEQENSLEVELSVSLERINRLQSDYNNARRDVRSIASNASTLEVLEAEVNSASEEYLKAEQEFSNAVNQSKLGTSNIRLSYPGEIPEEPEIKYTLAYTALGFVLGLFTTVFVIIALELSDNKIKNPTKFRRIIGSDPIGIVSFYKNNKTDFAGIIQGKFKGLDSSESDAFLRNLRKMRFEIESFNKSVFLFTSLGKGSGKSFLMSSLAYSLSLADRRVLIIDTNFRDNSISISYNRYMAENGIASVGFDEWIEEFSRKRRLKNISAGEDHEEEEDYVGSNFITPTVNRNIDLVLSRTFQDSPLEVFSQAKLGKVLDYLLERYDFIFMEGAALNLYSDSKELSRYSKVIVPVFSINDNIESTSRSSIKFIENSENEVKMILNNVWPEDIGEA